MLPVHPVSKFIRPPEGFYASEVDSPRRLPVQTFLPTGYEPNYPYPLIVFFHGRGGNEQQIVRLAPRVSRRNYLCIALRGPLVLGRREDGALGCSWAIDDEAEAFAEEYVFRAILQARSTYHVHSERIFLAGFGEGATHAYRLGLTYPERFAGVIALNGRLPRGGPLLRLPEVRKLRVHLGHGIANVQTPLSEARGDFRLLYAAGLDVTLKTYPTTHRIHPDMLKDMDGWIMRIVAEEVGTGSSESD